MRRNGGHLFGDEVQVKLRRSSSAEGLVSTVLCIHSLQQSHALFQ